MKKKMIIGGIIVLIIFIIVVLFAIFLSNKEDEDNTNSKENSTTFTSLISVSEDEKYSSDHSNPSEKDDNIPDPDHLDVYDTKYEKVWKSEDGRIVFTNNNKLGLEGRGNYDGIYSSNNAKTKIYITIDDYRYWNKKYSLNLKNDGRLTMDKIISEDGVDVQTIILGSYYVIDDKNNKFTVTVDSVHNKHLKSGYKKGDKIVFSQVSE
ncbi:MAG: hypothetical protein ACI4RL_07340 [Ruminococcus sp.]